MTDASTIPNRPAVDVVVRHPDWDEPASAVICRQWGSDGRYHDVVWNGERAIAADGFDFTSESAPAVTSFLAPGGFWVARGVADSTGIRTFTAPIVEFRWTPTGWEPWCDAEMQRQAAQANWSMGDGSRHVRSIIGVVGVAAQSVSVEAQIAADLHRLVALTTEPTA